MFAQGPICAEGGFFEFSPDVGPPSGPVGFIPKIIVRESPESLIIMSEVV